MSEQFLYERLDAASRDLVVFPIPSCLSSLGAPTGSIVH